MVFRCTRHGKYCNCMSVSGDWSHSSHTPLTLDNRRHEAWWWWKTKLPNKKLFFLGIIFKKSDQILIKDDLTLLEFISYGCHCTCSIHNKHSLLIYRWYPRNERWYVWSSQTEVLAVVCCVSLETLGRLSAVSNVGYKRKQALLGWRVFSGDSLWVWWGPAMSACACTCTQSLLLRLSHGGSLVLWWVGGWGWGGFPKVRTTSEHSRVLADILKVGWLPSPHPYQTDS